MAKYSDKPAVVYCAVCIVNGKKYIGVTSRSLAKRRSDHKLSAARHVHNGHFHKAIRKHGIDSFIFSVLENCESMCIALQREIELIAALRPEYNNTLGGEGQLGRAMSAIARAKLIARNKKNKWARGYKMSPGHKAKLLDLHFGSKKPTSRPPDNSKQVVCLDDGKVFLSGAEAARFYGCHETQIRDVCKRKPHRKTAKGRRFAFVDNDNKKVA